MGCPETRAQHSAVHAGRRPSRERRVAALTARGGRRGTEQGVALSVSLCGPWESDDELGDSLLIRRSHSPAIPGQERLSRASWRTELAPEVMRRDSVVADFALEWQRGYEFDDLSSTAPGHNPNSAGEHPVVGWKRAMRTDRDPDWTVRRFLGL
jgi:hypothetical protein